MKRLLTTALILCEMSFFSPGRAQAPKTPTLETAILQTHADIAADTQALLTLREEISKKRSPLATRLESLQTSVAEHRIEIRRVRTLRQQSDGEQARLLAEATAVEENVRFLNDLFFEYARAMETRFSAAEADRLTQRLAPIQKELSENASPNTFAASVERLLSLSAELNNDRLGGTTFSGIALDEAGIEQEGLFASFGPVAYFRSTNGSLTGMAVTQFGGSRPAVFSSLGETAPHAITALVEGNPAVVPVDVSAGDAIKVQQAKPTLIEHVRKGGFVMIPLAAVAITALILSIWKSLELAGIRVRRDEKLDAVVHAIRNGDLDSARHSAQAIPPPLRSLVDAAVEHHSAPRSHLEEILHEHVLASLPRLERNLGTLAVLGGIAPLLGLLGTVTGMIHTFQLVTIFGSGDAKLLSGGISEALVTTETGLAIAIPVLLVHAFLARRARGIIGALETTAVHMVNDLKTEGPPS